MKKFFAFLTLLFISPLFVNAKEADIQIKSVELIEKSDTAVEKEAAKFEDLEIWFNLKFTKLNDNAKYKIVVTNTSDKDYEINKNHEEFSDEEYINYEFEYDDNDNLIKAGKDETFYVTVSYDKEVIDTDYVNNLYTNDNYMNLDFSTLFDNPKTSDNLINYIIIGGISLGIIIIITTKYKALGLGMMTLVLLVPIATKAVESYKIEINANVEIEKDDGLGTFSICNPNKIYQFEEGMTFDEWFDSPYNIDGFDNGYSRARLYKPDIYSDALLSYTPWPDFDLIDFFENEVIRDGQHYYCIWMGECVSPESKILTNTTGEYKLAKNIKENDDVVYYDFDTNSMKVGTISKVFVHKDATNFIRYTLEDGSYIEASDYHPIYIKDGFKSYTNINGYEKPVIGDEVKTNNGYKKITKIELYNGKEDFYDFMVVSKDGKVVDNYYANGILVHSAY